jgi:Skp family chaperone for outer membrane proteins
LPDKLLFRFLFEGTYRQQKQLFEAQSNSHCEMAFRNLGAAVEIMKTIRLLAAVAVLTATFAVSAVAQTTGGKIGLINPDAFYDSTKGITKMVAKLTSLNKEFEIPAADLQKLGARITALQTELKTLEEQARGGKVPVNETTVRQKAEEYDRLTREYKFKEEELKAQIQRREAAELGPVQQDIGKALQEFSKKNGYSIIFDVAKLYDGGMLLGVDETYDVTAAFIAFYNARPATPTATK